MSKYYTNYYTAAHWINTQLILCNSLPEIDSSIWDNMPAKFYDDEEESSFPEIFQWFLTNLSDWDKEYMEETFPDLIITFSEKLDLYVLAVNHFGTPWRCVACECSAEWAEINKDLLYNGY